MVSAAVRENDGVATMGQQSRYSAEFKQATIQELLVGEKRASQICRERRIDETTLRRWRLGDGGHRAAGLGPAGGGGGAAPGGPGGAQERGIRPLTLA